MKAAGELLSRPSVHIARRSRWPVDRPGCLPHCGRTKPHIDTGDGAFLTRVPFHAIPRHKRGGSQW